MIARVAVVVAVLALGALMLWHPAPRPALVSSALPAPAEPSAVPGARERSRRRAPADDGVLVVYVAGDVRNPGLYRLQPGERAAKAVGLAGGLRPSADAAGVNLAQRAEDGQEIFVPAVGESARAHTVRHRSTRHSPTPPPDRSVDVNRADAAELAAVPGIGRAVAGRIVELRSREGSFASLDELLDVAGMTPSRLERARPYLQTP